VADRDSVVELVDRARRARGFAIATYSGFAVGAAFRLADGGIVDGANIENASYGLTMCAERVALFKALSEGYRDFLAVDGQESIADAGRRPVVRLAIDRASGRVRRQSTRPLRADRARGMR
jgi:cytidine deaminase